MNAYGCDPVNLKKKKNRCFYDSNCMTLEKQHYGDSKKIDGFKGLRNE